jgi:hypothetical protein
MSALPPLPLKALTDGLKPYLPRGWLIEGSARPVDNVPTTVVKLQQLAVRKLTAAPLGALEIDMRATITAPGEHTQTVENKLDRDLLAFLNALNTHRVKWDEATKVIADSRLGYDITLTILALKE